MCYLAERMRRLGERLFDSYFRVDPRSLALFRIAYSTVLLFDLYWRFQVVDYFYTNEGLFPNHTLLWSPPARRMFSFFFMASNRGEALFGMALCGLVFTLLLVGYRTRLMQVLALICLVSLNSRILLLECGGDVILNLLGVWSVWLPLGRRFSVDAVLASLRARRENGAEELKDRAAFAPVNTKVASLAFFAVTLNFFFCYFFNTIQKNGPSWKDGSAVFLTLHQDRLITPIGVWIRENVPYEITQWLTWSTLVIEGAGALLIITPLLRKQARLIAFFMMPGLHLGFALCLDIGPFSYAMASFFTLLLMPEHWEAFARFASRFHRARTVYFDASCGFCFQCVRVLARLDVLNKLTFEPNDGPALPAGLGSDTTEKTVVVAEPDGRLRFREDAAAAALRSLPLGFIPATILRTPGLHLLARFAYNRVAGNRAEISQWLGMAACGLPQPKVAAASAFAPSEARRHLRATGFWLSQACIAVLIAANAGEMLRANFIVPSWMRYRQPQFLQLLIDYPRTIQGWRMFAPHAPPEDFNVAVEAYTIDGRLVDPYNEVASPHHPRGPFTSIPSHLGQDQFFTTYSLFLPRGNYRPYYTALQQWILRYHKRTGNPKDRIKRFKVYQLIDTSPSPGEREPKNFRKQLFYEYPPKKG